MAWYETLQQAINYMEAHLLDEINYEDVARQVNMSSYEFHRAFSFMSGVTANEYIRNRRLSLAGQELLEKDVKVIDVALKYGYDTPESFHKAFTRFHGVTPRLAKKPGSNLKLFNPMVIKIIMEGGKNMEYRLEETKRKKFIALVRAFSNEIINDDERQDIPEFWDECHKKNLVEPIRNLRPEGKRDLYGLCMPTREGSPTFDYGIGVIADDETKKISDEEMERNGYRIWDVEPGTYVVLKCMGNNGDCIGEMWTRFYKEFLPQMGYTSAEATDYEIYFERGEQGLFCELWIPVNKK